MLLPSEFYLHRFRLQVLLPMDTHTSSRRALKLVQEQEVAEDRRRPRNERQSSTCCRSERLWNKGVRKRRERSRARHAAQTASERQATLQWKSTCEHRAETGPERETNHCKNKSLLFVIAIIVYRTLCRRSDSYLLRVVTVTFISHLTLVSQVTGVV